MTRRKRGVAGLALVLFGVVLLAIGGEAGIHAWSWRFPLVVLWVLGVLGFIVAVALLVFFFYVCVQEIRGIDPPEGEEER